MNRRKFVKQTALASAGILLTGYATAHAATGSFPVVRTPAGKRKFTSPAVEKVIADVKANIGNKELAWMFENCFPNTLDTTVDFAIINEKPDTYIITGDIDAMWLRDSSAQVWPYLPLCKNDDKLKELIKGVINRQAKCILLDPYANAFYKDENKVSEWAKDITAMKPGIHERKWEVDSLCYPIRLAHGYWEATGDTTPFDDQWVAAMNLVLKTFKEQQRKNGQGPYSFMRSSKYATDSVPMNGYGYPAKPNGLICSMFRPSDDATVYSYHVPSNLFAAYSLKQLLQIPTRSRSEVDRKTTMELISDIENGIKEAFVISPRHSKVLAYEINGFGSFNLMDDANTPSLLSLPYLIPGMEKEHIYQNTRRYVLSEDNPFFYRGKAGHGIGGPHVGADMIWPISIIMRGLTSNNKQTIATCLEMLRKTHASTGFMHESFHKDDASKYTRPWFAWANSLFGEFMWKVYREDRGLLG